MTFDESRDIMNSIDSSSLASLRQDLYLAAVRYCGMRAEWALAEPPQRMQMDPHRTAAHDVFIDSCNILSRNMARTGEDNHWRELLGSDRKVIGDFACHLTALLGIRAR
jgi:hypothetical protein